MVLGLDYGCAVEVEHFVFVVVGGWHFGEVMWGVLYVLGN